MPITQATNHEKWKEKTQQSTLNINWCNRKNPASSKTKYFKKLTLRFIRYRLVHLLPCQQAYQGFQFWRGTWRHYWGPTGNRTNPCFFVYRGAKRIHIQDDVILVKLVQVLSGSLQTTDNSTVKQTAQENIDTRAREQTEQYYPSPPNTWVMYNKPYDSIDRVVILPWPS